MLTTPPPPRDRLIVALDLADVASAKKLVVTLGETVTFYKVGLELVMNGGIDFARDLAASSKQVFLDLKLLDISNTVEKAVANAARLGVTFLTVHGHDRKTLDAAVKGRGGSSLKLLSVTVMTHLDGTDLTEQGLFGTPEEVVSRRARLAIDAGFDGLITSPLELPRLRSELPRSALLVTPGIRPAATATGDQIRIATPSAAIGTGADYLVVGRPITAAPDPARAAAAIVAEIAGSFTVSSRD